MNDYNYKSGNTINSIKGNNNIVINSKSKNISEELWSQMRKDTLKMMKELPEDSKELEYAEEMHAYIIRKDEHGLKKFIKNNLNSFNVGVISGVASGAILDFIKSAIHYFNG